MKFSVILVLAIAGLTINASAQKPQKTKASHSSEKESKKGTHVAVKDSSNKNNAAQELRRVEQSGNKIAGARHAQAKTARAPVVKMDKKESNVPIHVSGGGNSGKGSKGKGGDSSKGRLRQKGSRH